MTMKAANCNSEEFAVGRLLSVKTSLDDEFEGQVITFDRPSNILVFIKEFSFLGQAEDPLDINKCYLDLNTLQSKDETAIRQAEINAQRIGVGVSSEGQSIFDALSKTLPVRWDKSVIVVMNEVRVNSPYLPEPVTGELPLPTSV